MRVAQFAGVVFHQRVIRQSSFRRGAGWQPGEAVFHFDGEGPTEEGADDGQQTQCRNRGKGQIQGDGSDDVTGQEQIQAEHQRATQAVFVGFVLARAAQIEGVCKRIRKQEHAQDAGDDHQYGKGFDTKSDIIDQMMQEYQHRALTFAPWVEADYTSEQAGRKR